VLRGTPPPRATAATTADDAMQSYLLEVAERGAKFALEQGRDGAGEWVVEMDGKGAPLGAADPGYIPTTGYGTAFIAEGLQELYRATRRPEPLLTSLTLLSGFVRMMDEPNRRGDAVGAAVAASYPGLRTLGHHMICLNLARQLHAGLDETIADRSLPPALATGDALANAAGVAAGGGGAAPVLAWLRGVLDRMVQAILGKFLHPELGLLSECLDHEYNRPDDGNEDFVYLGHAIETLWMVMAEAERRGDEALYARAARLFIRHVEAAWDPLCGGVLRGLNGRTHKYLLDEDAKVKWAHDEVMVGCLMILAHPPHEEGISAEASGGEAAADWAARSLRRVRAYMERSFRLQPRGSWKVGGDRHAKPDPNAEGISGYNMGCKSLPNRVEHYHHPRMLMLSIDACDRALFRATK
jgi:hypothetical protein